MQAHWKLADGRTVTADVAAGQSLMEAAVANNVPGIIGECGGCLSCATCHVYVAEEWIDAAGEAGDFEDAMLDVAEAERRATSRLSCQITMAPELDGIVVAVPQP